MSNTKQSNENKNTYNPIYGHLYINLFKLGHTGAKQNFSLNIESTKR